MVMGDLKSPMVCFLINKYSELFLLQPVVHEYIYNKDKVRKIISGTALFTCLLAAPAIAANCSEARDPMFAYYVIVRNSLALLNIFAMVLTYHKISRRLRTLYMRRVQSLNAAVSAKMRDDTVEFSGQHFSCRDTTGSANSRSLKQVALYESHSGSEEKIIADDLKVIDDDNLVPNSINPSIRSSRTEIDSKTGIKVSLIPRREIAKGKLRKTHVNNLTKTLPSYIVACTRRKREKRMTKIMFTATACFTVLVLPQCIKSAMEIIWHENWKGNCFAWAEHISVFLFNLHFLTNFFVYFLVNSAFRKRLKTFVTCSQPNSNENRGRFIETVN